MREKIGRMVEIMKPIYKVRNANLLPHVPFTHDLVFFSVFLPCLRRRFQMLKIPLRHFSLHIASQILILFLRRIFTFLFMIVILPQFLLLFSLKSVFFGFVVDCLPIMPWNHWPLFIVRILCIQ
jgi:hypothetical protein